MPTPVHLQATILESAEAACREWRLPGLAVWAGWRGRTLLAEGFGWADPERRQPVSADTLFPIASVTKPLTVHALENVVQRGSIDWNNRLPDLLPGFRLAAPDGGKDLTLTDMLAHRQPLPPHTWAWVFGNVDRKRFLLERLPHLAAVAGDPGAYRYSNIMYAVAGQVIEEATGMSWESYLRDGILNPYGLVRTQCLQEDWLHQAIDVAHPHQPGPDDANPMPPFFTRAGHPIAPASEVMSTVNDLGAWLQARLDQPPNPPCWQAHALIREQRLHPVLGPLEAGLGWRLDTFRGEPHAWHSGQCSGYCALVGLIPGQQFGLALLCNLDGALDALVRIAYQVYDRLLDQRDINWSEYLFSYPAATSEPPPPGPAICAPEFPGVAGLYEHPGYGSFEISEKAGGLVACLQSAGSGPLRHDAGSSCLDWHLSGYDRHFPVHIEPDIVRIRLEPELEPISFHRT